MIFNLVFNKSVLILLSAITLHLPSWASENAHLVSEIATARKLNASKPNLSPEAIAKAIKLETPAQKLIEWMYHDLLAYEARFDFIFESKLNRIARHQEQRQLEGVEKLLRFEQLKKGKLPEAEFFQERSKIVELNKAFGFVAAYSSAEEFRKRFIVGDTRLQKAELSDSEIERMNRPGLKKVFVDTWGVIFFNSGLQSKAQAHRGLKRTILKFEKAIQKEQLSLYDFFRLMALFSRPEFDDLRRFKLQPFPTRTESARFKFERNDAQIAATSFPTDAFLVSNSEVEIDPLSYMLGRRVHLLGLVSHLTEESVADGRIFTGPSDFLEHDWFHAFLNRYSNLPGNVSDWHRIHSEFKELLATEKNPLTRLLLRLIYFHFTHESGFRSIQKEQLWGGEVNEQALYSELQTILALLEIKFHYDWVKKTLKDDGNSTFNLEKSVASAFQRVSDFFVPRYLDLKKSCSYILR